VFVELAVVTLGALVRFLSQEHQDTKLTKSVTTAQSNRLHVHVLALEALQLLLQQFLLHLPLIGWERAKALTLCSLVYRAVDLGVNR
jgi:uncharacterized membrane protein